MPVPSLSITGEQIRAARALARAEQAELAQRSSLSLQTIKRLEGIRGTVDANVRTLNAIVQAFEGMGVRFLANDGETGVCSTGMDVSRPPPPVSPPHRPHQEPALFRLIYFSRAVAMDDAQLDQAVADIVKTAMSRNAAMGVTGALLVRDGRFLQTLEGPKDAVLQIYGAISTDRRHRDLNVLESRAVAARHFADWAMCAAFAAPDDVVFGREPAMAKGFDPDLLTPATAIGLLSIARDLKLERA